jgi:replication-associated recombination protein RarA
LKVFGSTLVLLAVSPLVNLSLWKDPLKLLVSSQENENQHLAITQNILNKWRDGDDPEMKQIMKEEEEWTYNKRRTILFVDEIHRFNKAQQDAFLPHVEKGTIILIGATTENPSFEVISPLLSRTKVFTLYSLNRRRD